MGACASRPFSRNRHRRREDLERNEPNDANDPCGVQDVVSLSDVFASPYMITIVALYDYEEEAQDDLAFATGDHMIVEEDDWTSNVNWVMAFNLRTRQCGLVPKNYVREVWDERQSQSVTSRPARLEQSTRSPRQQNVPRPRTILDRLTREVCQAGFQMVRLTRHDAVRDFLDYLAKPDFEPRRRIIVSFKGEEGVDQGGPTRDLATAILQHLQHSQVLEGPAGKMCLSHSLGALHRREYLMAGQLVAFVLCHAAMACPLFSESVVRLVCAYSDCPVTLPSRHRRSQHQHQEQDQDQDQDLKCEERLRRGERSDDDKRVLDDILDDIPQGHFRSQLKEIEESDFPCDLAEEVADEIGYYEVLNADKKSAFLHVACQYYLYHRCRSELEQFKMGLNQFGALGVLRKYPEQALSILCGSQMRPLTADEMMKMFMIIWRGDCDQRRYEEQDTFFEFQFFLKDCENGEAECSLQDVLYFVSGAREIPPGGFGTRATLTFAKIPYPQVSTCTLELTLPLSLPPNKTLKDVMTLAVSSPEFAVP